MVCTGRVYLEIMICRYLRLMSQNTYIYTYRREKNTLGMIDNDKLLELNLQR